jgi:hypothetical protein
MRMPGCYRLLESRKKIGCRTTDFVVVTQVTKGGRAVLAETEGSA